MDAIWDKIWSSGVSNPLTAIDYFSTVLLLRRIDGQRTDPTDVGETSAWAKLHEYIDSNDVSAVSQLMVRTQTDFGIGASPEVASSSMWRDLATLREVLSDVANLRLSDRNHDILGDVFEYMLNHLSTAGHFGQFRTPRHIIRFIVEAVAPRQGEVVVDPACGTAGFLIAAHEFRGHEGGQLYVGNEVDSTIARVARTNVLLHEMSGADIRHGDALQVKTRDADVVLANPPFAGAVVADRVIQFESGTLKTELLFIEHMMRRLRDHGRAGVVVPTGVLTSSASGAVWVRRELVEGNRLRAVVELPGGVFRPYTDVRTGLLFWSNDPSDGDVLMVRIENDGYSLDDRRQPIEGSDLPGALRLLAGETASVPHVRVARDEIANHKYNLSPTRYIKQGDVEEFGLRGLDFAASLANVRQASQELLDELANLERLAR